MSSALAALALLVGGVMIDRLRPAPSGRLARPAAGASPLRIPLAAWWPIVKKAAWEFNEDRIPAVAAGVGFYGLLALFPALAAFVSFYGLFGDIEDAREALSLFAGLAPPETLAFMGAEMVRIAAAHHAQLSLTFAVGLAVSIWSANAAMNALLGGLDVAYEVRESRNFFILNLVSLSFTVGAIGVALVSSALIVAAPNAAAWLGLGAVDIVAVARWPALLAVVIALLAVLYRYGPSRPHARWRWVSPGSLVAAAAWLLISLAFSDYVATFGHYDRTYGPLGAVVGLMIWLWITVIVVLFGAELNCAVEQQSSARPRPGSRLN